MKKSWSLIALAAALSASAAYAADPSTPTNTATTAGTEIKNKAEITFTPEATPTNPTPTPTTTPSNEVTTTVQAVPSFTITPNDKSGDPTKPDYSQPGQTNPSVKPCDKNVSFLYKLTNTGNVNGESYTITNTAPPAGSTVKSPENVRYALDANNNGVLDPAELSAATATLKITSVDRDKTVQFFAVYDIPCTASDKDVFGTDPTGTRDNQTDPKLNPSTPVPQDGNNSNTSTVNRQDGVILGPKDDPNADNKTDPANTAPNPVYTQPASGGDTTPDVIYPGGTTLPGGTSTVPADTQQAIDKCTTGTNVVTFTNTVQNKGNRSDVFNITTVTANLPAGATVQLLKTDGTTALSDTNNDGIVDVGALAPNGTTGDTASFLVRVTYTGCLTADATVTVTATSTNDPKLSDPTKDQIVTPKVSFGDPSTNNGGDPAPVGTPPAGTPGNPNTPVDQSKCTGTGTLTYLPMEIGNTGSVPDKYTITGTAPIKLTDGTTQNVPVVYYLDTNNNGTYEAGTDTPLTGGTTPVIQPGTELKLIAAVTVPCSAIAQTITLEQTAKSPDTGATGTDTNDTITVGGNGKQPTVDKKVDLASAKPGDVLTYTIVGTNPSNSNVTKAMVCDTVPANTTFDSISATSAAGPVLYSNNGGNTWQSAPVTTPGTKLCVGVDSNGDGNITTADILRPGQSINVTFKVKVN